MMLAVPQAARELNVPSADLRKLVLLDQRLSDASTEAVELDLDASEANLREGLRSDDPKLARRHFDVLSSQRRRARRSGVMRPRLRRPVSRSASATWVSG